MKLALECIDKEVRRITFDADLYTTYKATYGENAWKKRKRLKQAKKTLSNLQLGLFKQENIE